MSKTYCDFQDEITAGELYEGLLAHGLFAEKIPPVFTSVPFFEYCKTLSQPFSDKAWRDYVSFSSMRNINIPRNLGVPTPMKYQRLCLVLSDNWDKIKEHFHSQTDGQEYKISRIHLRKREGHPELFKMNYKDWRVDGNPETDLLITDARVNRYLVKADISTCFPSIYTHSLPWALVGKGVAKANCKDDEQYYNKIDAACSTMKNGETHGLLIGPHASNLLAEIILTVVDKRLYDRGCRYFRNIDDYNCYVDSYENAQNFLHDLETELKEFDLQLNHKKTEIIELPVANTQNWIHKLNQMNLVTPYGWTTYKAADAYIDIALQLVTKTGDSAVLKYAIKVLSGKKLSDHAKKLIAKRLMHLAVLYPYLLQLMEEYVFKPCGVENEEIRIFAETIYTEALRINNHEAICYAIYYGLKYDFDLSINLDDLIKKSDCITLAITWVYFNKKKAKAEIKKLKDEAKRLKVSDFDRYWLFVYEALPMSLLSDEWKPMKAAKVSFIKDGF